MLKTKTMTTQEKIDYLADAIEGMIEAKLTEASENFDGDYEKIYLAHANIKKALAVLF